MPGTMPGGGYHAGHHAGRGHNAGRRYSAGTTPAAAGIRFIPNGVLLTIAAGRSTATMTLPDPAEFADRATLLVTTIDDNVVEADGSIRAAIRSRENGGYELATPTSVTVTRCAITMKVSA